jgi:hypothetical protein
MNPITLSWEDWLAVIAVLREKALPYMLEHANVIEEQLERHGPNEPMVRLNLADDVFLRSYNWVQLRQGIPLPPMARPAIDTAESASSGGAWSQATIDEIEPDFRPVPNADSRPNDT